MLKFGCASFSHLCLGGSLFLAGIPSTFWLQSSLTWLPCFMHQMSAVTLGLWRQGKCHCWWAWAPTQTQCPKSQRQWSLYLEEDKLFLGFKCKISRWHCGEPVGGLLNVCHDLGLFALIHRFFLCVKWAEKMGICEHRQPGYCWLRVDHAHRHVQPFTTVVWRYHLQSKPWICVGCVCN